ncbi:MAG: hypothetical protein F6J98_02395 [Moorea sp. SIO4G2]|nr:hypothetical protein [Moorena sp. SIO4G2]
MPRTDFHNFVVTHLINNYCERALLDVQKLLPTKILSKGMSLPEAKCEIINHLYRLGYQLFQPGVLVETKIEQKFMLTYAIIPQEILASHLKESRQRYPHFEPFFCFDYIDGELCYCFVYLPRKEGAPVAKKNSDFPIFFLESEVWESSDFFWNTINNKFHDGFQMNFYCNPNENSFSSSSYYSRFDVHRIWTDQKNYRPEIPMLQHLVKSDWGKRLAS